MKIDLTGKTALITGGTGTIGSAIAEAYIKSGANVVLVARDEQKGEKIASELGATFIKGDVSSRENIRSAVAETIEKFGKIDILVTAAGVRQDPTAKVPLYEMSESEFDDIMQTDLTGVFNTTKTVAENMRKNNYGRIIHISDAFGIKPGRNQSAYDAAKAGIIHFTHATACELAPFGIVVNAICPVAIDSPSTNAQFASDGKFEEQLMSHIPMHRKGTVKEVADVAVMLASEEVSYMTGNIISLDGGFVCGFARDY